MDSDGKSFPAGGSLARCEFISPWGKEIQVQKAAKGSFQAQRGHGNTRSRLETTLPPLSNLREGFIGSCLKGIWGTF